MIAAAFIVHPALAQQADLFEDETELLETLDDEKKNELVVAPIPIVNPTFGAGLAALGMYLYHLDDLLPSAGLGLRFKLSKTTDFNLSVDYAVGKDSDEWYFYVGESF